MNTMMSSMVSGVAVDGDFTDPSFVGDVALILLPLMVLLLTIAAVTGKLKSTWFIISSFLTFIILAFSIIYSAVLAPANQDQYEENLEAIQSEYDLESITVDSEHSAEQGGFFSDDTDRQVYPATAEHELGVLNGYLLQSDNGEWSFVIESGYTFEELFQSAQDQQ